MMGKQKRSDAQAMSLRRAVASIGLGRYLYYPEITSATATPSTPSVLVQDVVKV
jgi:hypothetical protein